MSDPTRIGLTALLATVLVAIIDWVQSIAREYGYEVNSTFRWFILALSLSIVVIIWGDRL